MSKRPRQKIARLLILTLIPVLAAAGGCTGTAPLVAGNTVRDFSLRTIDGNRFYLNQHRGEVLVLVFWATWCTHCKHELAEITGLSREFPGVRVAGICTDPENTVQIRQMIREMNLNYPVLMDPGGGLFKKLGFRALPTTVVIGPDSRAELIYKGFNAQIYRQMKAKISRLLESAPSDS